MKLIIFGATGTIGRQLVDQALSQGHQVTAFARNPATLPKDRGELTLVAGNVFDKDAVADAVRGHDAVVVVLGAGRRGMVRSVGTRHIIDAMERHGVRRLICQSTLGVGDSHGQLNFFWKHIMFGLLLRDAFADHQAQEALVRQSALDWTIVRPASFTDGPATGAYKHGPALTETKLTLKISRADVGDFLLRQLTDNGYLRKSPGISY